ncbi:hypothetical protein SAMN05216337_104283 [Bradyrhizobium brasilense]|uniref:Uncharacterized protein n=1 Tax=Bradyrhizobium brasilense TaxID=1419277 RepID=A0A1G7HPN8_9BRAD|nr:hypothetical protein [Bradyrhizobium brasilense]SDF02264.1 hypothetical protein SAMN05216337_104283 [Bradyrhizobium brasilense]
MSDDCPICDGTRWVCENHPDRPWQGERACTCGGAGAPCPACNKANEGEMPSLPKGFRATFDKRGWRQH